MEVGTIRDYLVVITTVITILGAFFKTLNQFFLDIIKNNFEVVPGKQSLYNTIIKTIVYIIFIIEITIVFLFGLVVVGEIINLIFKNSIGSILKETYSIFVVFDNNPLVKLTINICCLILIYLLFFFVYKMVYLIKKVYEVLDMKKEDNNSKILKSISIKINSVIAKIIAGICVLNIIIINKNLIIIEEIIILGILATVSISISIILDSLIPIIDVVNKRYQYYIILKTNEVYIVDFFLDYENSYLIVESNVQKYINRQEVKEIKKLINKDKSKT